MRKQLETNGNAAVGGVGGRHPGRMLAFRVDGRRYAMRIEAVLAVSEGVAGGAVTYREREVSVQDARDLGMGAAPAARPGTGGAVLVFGRARDPRAVRVDEIEGIVEGAETRRWPELVAALVGPGFPGLVLQGEAALLLVDADALTADGRTLDAGRREEREKT